MTRVAAGCPTTFCDKTAVRSAAGSADCFFARFPPLVGFSFSTPPLSDLIIAAECVRTLDLRRSSGGLGSFIQGLFADLIQQFTSSRKARQNICCKPVTASHALLVSCLTRLCVFVAAHISTGSWGGRMELSGTGITGAGQFHPAPQLS